MPNFKRSTDYTDFFFTNLRNLRIIIFLDQPNCNGSGRLRIDRTRIRVHRIATLYKQGLMAEDIIQTYPHLSYSQIYVALAYYHENQAQALVLSAINPVQLNGQMYSA